VSSERGRSLSLEECAVQALAALDGGHPMAIVTVVAAPDDSSLGRRMVVTAESTEGSLGSAGLDESATTLARQAIEAGQCELREVEHSGDVWRLYGEPVLATPELVVVGAGHIARPLCRMAAMLGFKVVVLDDRPEFASESWFPDAMSVHLVDFNDAFRDVGIGPSSHIVLVTRGHKYDYDCILQLLKREARPAYLGMIGSRRRVRATFEALVRDGVAPERLIDVRAPIGLDIGAETPEEIALAIAAEIVAVRRGGSGGALSQEERVLARVEARGKGKGWGLGRS
jgi:xanthine dehydrogenase accessory factor